MFRPNFVKSYSKQFTKLKELHLQQIVEKSQMKGNDTFTTNDINLLRNIISQLRNASPQKQKNLRQKMRNKNFYISDFSSNISPETFENLISSGRIKISDAPCKIEKEVEVTIETKPSCISKIKENIRGLFGKPKQESILSSFEPIVDDNSKILILGTMPGQESLNTGEYYASNRNSMWRILSDVFNKGNEFVSYEEKKKCLYEHHIAMWDTIKSCNREGSLDSNISDVVPNDVVKFLETHPNIIRVIANGGKAAGYMPAGVNYVKAPSTSNANAIKYKDKLSEWRKLLIV